MPDDPLPRPATTLRIVPLDEVRDALARSLRRQRQRSPHASDDLIARLAAERITADLTAEGYVVVARSGGDTTHADSGDMVHADSGDTVHADFGDTVQRI
jgi:hypothetical protein